MLRPLICALVFAVSASLGAEELYVAKPLTPEKTFTSGIEGPACDLAGNIFLVGFKEKSNIARVTPDGRAELFVTLPDGSTGNGIRFDTDGFLYVADYSNHNVLRVDPKSRQVSVLAHHGGMSQPNDLAIAPDGTLYASDPNWGGGTGQIWRIDRWGEITRLQADMGTTNGIEVSPDGKRLYVNESVQRNIWVFDITDLRTLENKRLLREFPDHGFDGMRCDVDGNLYVTRYGKGTIVKLSPTGEILREIKVLGSRASNLCFGGPDGRTAYVTDVDNEQLVQFRVERPGLAWKRWQESALKRGFVPLFDGRSLDGWKVHDGLPADQRAGRWTVEDGTIVGRQHPPGQGGLLTTLKKYRDFEVELETKIQKPFDSGVFLRMGPHGKSHQVTLDYHKTGEIGGIYCAWTQGFVFHCPDGAKSFKEGAWNRLKVRIEGEPAHIRVWLNDQLITDFQHTEKTTENVPKEGTLCVQIHPGGEGYDANYAAFREIRIRELK